MQYSVTLTSCCFTATPAAITWVHGTVETMPRHHVITHTGSIRAIPVLEMTMGQDPEVTGVWMSYNWCVCDGRLRIQPNISLFLSDRDGYGGGREPRAYMDRPSSGSYREPYDSYGKIKPLVWWKGLRGSNQTACFAPGKGCLMSLPKSGNIKCGVLSSWVFHPR